jgi:LPS O-antigen subunit length determinant protein (WzzB/FepE family)
MQEDEIDLRELFMSVWAKRWFVFVFTCVITVVAVVYALLKTPIYEANALIEIGNYKLDNNNNNNRTFLDNASQLSQKLNVLFIDLYKNAKDVDAKILSINMPKKQDGFLEVKAEGVSNETAIQEIQKVIAYIKTEHQKILDDVKQRRELEINNIDLKIENIKNKEIVLLNEKISLQEENLQGYKKQLELIDANIKKIENTNPTLAALKLMEKRDLNNFILNLNLQLLEMKNKKDELETSAINELLEKKNLLISMLLPHNYKNSEVIGQIITNDYPIKPKKKLIVVVAFVSGFILSIFLVFFMEFIKGFKEESE